MLLQVHEKNQKNSTFQSILKPLCYCNFVQKLLIKLKNLILGSSGPKTPKPDLFFLKKIQVRHFRWYPKFMKKIRTFLRAVPEKNSGQKDKRTEHISKDPYFVAQKFESFRKLTKAYTDDFPF